MSDRFPAANYKDIIKVAIKSAAFIFAGRQKAVMKFGAGIVMAGRQPYQNIAKKLLSEEL